MSSHTKTEIFFGLAGRINCSIEWPNSSICGWALILHPHPLYGGTRDNKVVTILSHACLQNGLVTVRPDFRGVRDSEGTFSNAIGETDDMLELIKQISERYPEISKMPWIIGGFSFGSIVSIYIYNRILEFNIKKLPNALILAGLAVSRFQIGNAKIPNNTLVIHGEIDEIIPFQDVVNWARPKLIPITMIPGSSHFFDGKLLILRRLVYEYLKVTLNL